MDTFLLCRYDKHANISTVSLEKNVGNMQIKEDTLDRLATLKGTCGNSFTQVIEYLMNEHEGKEQMRQTEREARDKTTNELILEEIRSIRMAAWMQVDQYSGGEPPANIGDPEASAFSLEWRYAHNRPRAGEI